MESDAKYSVVPTQDSYGYRLWAILATWSDARGRACADTVEIMDDRREAQKLARRMQHARDELADWGATLQ